MSLKPVLHSFSYSLDFLREQVADVADTVMTQQPAGIRNHPAWLIGHLVVVCEAIGGAIGASQWLAEDFRRRYGSGSEPVSNAAVYEAKEVALAMLREAQDRLTAAVEQLDEARLDEPFPDPSLHDVFPTIRNALVQVLVGHTAYHVGELAVWRRAMGLPRLGRSYE